mmetsp:Transcript_88905/g.226230  ORF Transcript_88905/g.226230 Transcript_88905/m.226230 type:complete len:87 (+) Transcript_88905:349-609(+)
MVEHISRSIIGLSHTAGWVNATTFIENDNKFLAGKFEVLKYWGLYNVEQATTTSITGLYRSMRKGNFRIVLEAQPSVIDAIAQALV